MTVRDAKYVARFGSSLAVRLFQRALQSKKYYTNGTHEALISAWNRGSSATRALNAQPPLFRLLATRPNMTWGGLRVG
jgi:hypothetical protein